MEEDRKTLNVEDFAPSVSCCLGKLSNAGVLMEKVGQVPLSRGKVSEVVQRRRSLWYFQAPRWREDKDAEPFSCGLQSRRC